MQFWRKPEGAGGRRRLVLAALALPLGVMASTLAPTASVGASPISIQVVSPGVLAPGTTLASKASAGVVRVEYTLQTTPGYSQTTYLLGSSSTAPFSVQWNGVPSGFLHNPSEYLLVATAFDQFGGSVRSDAPVGGVQRRTSVNVPGTWPTISNRTFAASPTSSSGGAVTRSLNLGGGNFQPYTALPSAGSTATFTLSAKAAARFNVHVSHTLLNQPSAPTQIAVNGVVVANSVSFDASTPQFGVLAVKTVAANLKQGTNTITVTSLGANGPSVVNVYAAQG
jgi:hypothetical protein